MPKLLKSKPIQPLYTRGGTPIADGFDPLAPTAPVGAVLPIEVQNPNQMEPNKMLGGAGTVGIGRANAGPARTGAFGYGIRRRSFEQYNTPITDPRSQAPGAPITQRPIVPINPGNPGGGGRGANFNRGQRPGGFPEAIANPPSVRDISTPPSSSGMQAMSLGRPLAGVGVRAASVSKSTSSASGKVTATPAKAASPKPAVQTAASPTTSTKNTKKTGKSGSLLRR
jgi:hypothetical protein